MCRANPLLGFFKVKTSKQKASHLLRNFVIAVILADSLVVVWDDYANRVTDARVSRKGTDNKSFRFATSVITIEPQRKPDEWITS